MKIRPLISIIVPIYNVKDYLRRCLDSIINQTYEKIEIILIDDGSTDGCDIIVDSYSNLDKRVIPVHKKNGGLSDARNVGIELAKGDYYLFIDSDDWISNDYVESYYKIVEKVDADIIIGHLKKTFGKEEKKELISSISCKEISKEETYKKILMQDGIDVSACAKLYSKRIFNNIRFPKGTLYEDFYIFGDTIEAAKKIVVTDYCGYYYFIRSGSIMQSKFNNERLVLIDRAKEYVGFIDKNYPNLHVPAIRRYIVSIFGILSTSVLDSNSKNINKNLRKEVLKKKKLIFFDKRFSLRIKFQSIVIMFGIFPYKLMMYIKHFLRKIKNK